MVNMLLVLGVNFQHALGLKLGLKMEILKDTNSSFGFAGFVDFFFLSFSGNIMNMHVTSSCLAYLISCWI